MAAVGDVIGAYRLESLVGEGGMGLVFRAVREPDGGAVALKILRSELCDDAVYRRRFVHEARSAGAIRHPHLVPILDAAEHDARPYLVAEFVQGRTLEDSLASAGPLPVEELLRVADEVGSALDALHAAGIVHRDVKASNILCRATDGAALLTDFGLATARTYTVLTQHGQVLGSIDYLAPELIRGEAATAASDLYSLGCVLYECAAGAPPFAGRSPLQVGLAHLDEEPETPRRKRPDLPEATARALLTALEKDPARRPGSAAEYARALRGAGAPSR